MASPNINKHFWRRCRGERWFAEITLSLAIILYYTFILLFFFIFIFSIFMDNSNSTPIIKFFAPSETSHRPWETSPFFAPNYDLCLELIAIGQNQPFSIAEVLSFDQEDNELLATPTESVNLSINIGLNLRPCFFSIFLHWS